MKKWTSILLIAAACSRAPDDAPRVLVRTANVKIVVADTSRTVAAVSRSIESAGGYVSDSSMWREGDVLRARLKVHVPADKLTSTLASIRAQATRVERETIRSAPRSALPITAARRGV